MSAPPSESVGWKDPSASPNEAAEAGWDLPVDCEQKIQSRIQREKVSKVQRVFFSPHVPLVS
jgi:hypothetical protein